MSTQYIGNTDILYIINKIKQVLDGTNGFAPGYVQKVSGKQLSTEDFTSTLLSKLNGITDSADAVSWDQMQTAGTKVATITINGTPIDIYVPTQTIDSQMSDSSANAVQKLAIPMIFTLIIWHMRSWRMTRNRSIVMECYCGYPIQISMVNK